MTPTKTIQRTLALTGLAAVAAIGLAGPVQAEAPAWRTIAATGPTHVAPFVNDRQTVTVQASDGTFRLTFEGDTTGDIAFNANTQTVEAALNALPSISSQGSVSVTGGFVGSFTRAWPYVVEFDGGSFAGEEVSTITATGGSPPLSFVPAPVLTVGPTPSGELVVSATNVGGAASSGPLTVAIGPLPAGITTAGTAKSPNNDSWSCLPAGAGHSTLTCEWSESLGSMLSTDFVSVPIRVGPTAAPTSSVQAAATGGGAAPDPLERNTYTAPIVVSNGLAPQGIQAFWAGAFDADGEPFTQAGGHPNGAATFFMVNTKRNAVGKIIPIGDPRDVVVDLPAGFVGNPLVTDRCPPTRRGCGGSTRVGAVHPLLQGFPSQINPEIDANQPLSNDTPTPGYAGQFTFPAADARPSVVASVRTEDDYGVTATSPQIPTSYRIYGAYAYLEGSPAGADGKAFLTNPTDCSGEVLPTWISVSAWQQPGVFSDPLNSDSPATTGCDLVPFDPAVSIAPTSAAADSASGLDASIDLSQDNLLDPNKIATSHLKKTVVRLPGGVSVNPSGATGLKGCSDAQVGLKSNAEPSCPDGSKLGTVSVTSPLLDQPLDGAMYLGTPKSTDPTSGQMLRLFLVVRNDRYGLMVKLPGSATADPQTGQLTATFDENPRVPFDHLDVRLRGGSRGLLATPQDCGPAPTSAVLSPWSATADVTETTPFEVAGNCGLGFAPSLTAGMSTSKARSSGTFSFKFSRRDGEQWIDGLSAKLPQGLLASVKDVPLCSDAQAAAGACPAASRVGAVDATAGSGDPFVLERKGSAYLTEGYKGCAYGLLVSVPVVAGPFDASSPETDLGSVNVRQAVCVDRATAEVSAISDPLPTIWHGIPLRVRSVTVLVDRPGFMLNPSDCSTEQVDATFHSARGAASSTQVPFGASGCSSLAFKPKLGLRLTGRKQVRTGKHPGVRATVTQKGVSEAGIEKAVVRLPKSLALDPNNAQALCEFADGTRPDLENHCPEGSIVGRARARTPLLKDDLVGNVYFVKNVRTDAKTGNQIRTLPMIVVALRGEIAVNLKGESSTARGGRLVNTFASVPDAPISRFSLNIRGGKRGIITVTRTRRARINLCAGRHVAEVDTDGQNGRRHDFDVRMKTPCTQRQTRRAKRAAKKAAAKRAVARKAQRG